ncbi:YgjP-like metallopeptidase domain-containing protein, partial [Roseiarcus sp.]|uniref:YgjP-like metallopeptidase domain-containing protein n=1 Tax=Roseiarcus sp. TaxID=1969460 RepID=UPI003F96B7F9
MAKSGLLRLFERGPEPTHLDLRHNGEVYRIAVNRSTRSRRFTLRVRAASRDVLLTMPARASMTAAREFAERHSAWIGVRLARLPRPVAFEPHATMPLRGVDHTIVHRPGARGVVWTETGDEGALLCVAGERPHVARRVHDFLRREAMKDIEAAVA